MVKFGQGVSYCEAVNQSTEGRLELVDAQIVGILRVQRFFMDGDELGEIHTYIHGDGIHRR